MSKNTYLPIILTDVGYGRQAEHITGGLSDIFQTTVGKMIFAKIIGGLCVITPSLYLHAHIQHRQSSSLSSYFRDDS